MFIMSVESINARKLISERMQNFLTVNRLIFIRLRFSGKAYVNMSYRRFLKVLIRSAMKSAIESAMTEREICCILF